MVSQQRVNILRPGDIFRDWLIEVLWEKIDNKKCNVIVYRFHHASHTICRYEFEGEGHSVVAKFYAEPKGSKKHYNPVKAMEKEFKVLRKVEKIIDVPRPIAIKKEFNCVLVTEYIRGKSLYRHMRTEEQLYDRLTSVAHMLRRLHDQTRSKYHKEKEFANYHKLLDDLRLDRSTREMYNRLLGEWWYSTLLDQQQGCMIHNDANPLNYIFDHDKLYALDFESSWEHANFIHDLGIVAAELKNYFGWHRKSDERAEPYIGHFLWKYSNDEGEFRGITQALPFFMSLGLLRVARLCLSPDHRDYIFKEALACLRAKDLKARR